VFAVVTGKTLILSGANNEINAAFEVPNTGGTLLIEQGATLEVYGPTVVAVGGTWLTNKGLIEFIPVASRLVYNRGGDITNDGIIRTNTNVEDQLEILLELPGEGSIEFNGGDLALNDHTALKQHLVILDSAVPNRITAVDLPENTNVTPFDGIISGKTVTIKGRRPGQTVDGEFILPNDIENIGYPNMVINEGKIVTATTSPLVLTTIFDNSNNKGTVEATGVLVPFTQDFTVPNGISLDLISNSPLLSNTVAPAPIGPFDLFINGTLHVQGADITPSGNVTIGSDGLLILGLLLPAPNNTQYNLILAPAKTLTIPSATVIVSNIAGPGLVNASAIDSVIRISGDIYTTTTDGVIAEKIVEILEIFAEDKAVLTDNVTLDTPFGGGLGIGSVLFEPGTTPVTAVAVRKERDGQVGIIDDLKIFSAINDASYVSNTPIDNLDGIRVSVISSGLADNSNVVVAIDPNYGGPVAKYVTLNYHEARLEYEDLIGPVLPAFNVGVRTNRAQ
jgi:hypothetical protein